MRPGGSSGSGAPDGPDASGAPRLRLAHVVSITVTSIMGNVLVAPALPDIVADFGVADSGAAVLLAVTTAPGIVLAPLAGVLADRYGRREVLLPCLVLFGLAGGLSTWAPSFAVLVALRFLQGVGSAGLLNLAISLIGDTWSGVERSRMMGRNAAALTAAIVVLPPVGGFLTDLGGWRASFVPYWLALATAALIRRRLPRGRKADGSLAAQVALVRPALRSRAVVVPIVLGFGLFVVIFGLFFTVVPFYLDSEFGVDAGGRGLVLALPALTSTVASLNLARLRARFAVRALLVVGFALFVAGFLTAAAVPTLAALCLGVLLYGAGDGLVIATLQDEVTGAAPPSSRAAVIAVFVGVARAGQTLGPVLAGAGLAGPGARATLAAGAVLSAVLALTAHLLVGRGRPVVAPAAG